MMQNFDHQILSRNDFGIIDAAMLPYLPEGITTVALVPEEMSGNDHLMPLLVDLRTISGEKKDTLLQSLYSAHISNEWPVVALFIKTQKSATAFARHWNNIQLGVPEPGRKVWLRLHDTRVLHQLLRIISPRPRANLIGCFEALTYWVGEEWVTVLAKNNFLPQWSAGDSRPTPPNPTSISLDWSRVRQIGIINRALQRRGTQDAASLTSLGALAEQLITRARQLHLLEHDDDLVEFAKRGLVSILTFDEHPSIAAVIASDDDDESNLSHRFSRIEENIWDELRLKPTIPHER